MRRRPVSSTWIKYPYFWLSVALFLLASIGIFSSRAQSLLSIQTTEIAETKPRNTLPYDPVYGPLARSAHIRKIPRAPERPVSADNLTLLEPSHSWNGWSELEWWVPEDQDLSLEVNWLRDIHPQASRGRISAQDLLPKLQSRDIDPQAIMSYFITIGVTDLLNDLSEQEAAGALGEDAHNTNPFEKALKEAIDESKEGVSEAGSEPEQVEEKAETDASNEETSGADEAAGGGGAPIDCNLLFIGSFGGRPLATAVGTVQPDLLRQSLNNTIYIELEGAGKQYLNIDVVLRNRNNQESVAFGDLNRDGFIDMVVTSQTTNKAKIFKNDGQGTYETSGEIFGGLGPTAAVIGDFNSDGSSDIAVALLTDKTIVVDGKGLRKFIFLPTSRVAEEFTSITPYDFDDDGLTDLLLSNYGDFVATVYLNQNYGLFSVSDSFSLQEFPILQSQVDLDGDGIEDRIYIQNLGDNISVAMMNGKNGIIRNLGNMILDSSLYFVLGDFNVDRIVDIGLAHRK